MTGEKDHMYKVGSSIADNYSGTYLSLAIVMALFQRERTGMGRRVDVSMLDTIFSILETGALSYKLNGTVVEPVGNRNLSVAPCDIFKAADGQFALVCGTSDFGGLCAALWENRSWPMTRDLPIINCGANIIPMN